MRRSSLLPAVVIAATVVAGPSAAQAATVRPNLSVPSGSAHYRGGTLTGSFVVRATRAGAGTTKASLFVAALSNRRIAIRSYSIRRLRVGGLARVKVSAKLPAGLPVGTLSIRVCADATHRVRERSESDNCRTLVRISVSASAGSPSTSSPSPSETPTSFPQTPAGATRSSSAVTAPIASYPKSSGFEVQGPMASYWTYVPDFYDRTHKTPSKLFVWMHGCGGEAKGDIGPLTFADQDWITISLGGKEDACWEPGSQRDQQIVMTSIADVETHFNIDPRQVVVGGYSSGGDLAYRVAFYNAYSFAGVLAENSAPFQDTGSTQQQSVAAAYWKFNVVHLAHDRDGAYPIDEVTREVQALKDAGFPASLVVRPGSHFDSPSTYTDVVDYLLPHMDDGWLAPP